MKDNIPEEDLNDLLEYNFIADQHHVSLEEREKIKSLLSREIGIAYPEFKHQIHDA